MRKFKKAIRKMSYVMLLMSRDLQVSLYGITLRAAYEEKKFIPWVKLRIKLGKAERRLRFTNRELKKRLEG